MPETRTEIRTIDLSTIGNRFREGPVLLDGLRKATGQISQHSSTVLVGGVFELKGGADTNFPQALASAITFDTTNRFRRGIAVGNERFVDGVVTTVQTGVILKLILHLYDTEE